MCWASMSCRGNEKSCDGSCKVLSVETTFYMFVKVSKLCRDSHLHTLDSEHVGIFTRMSEYVEFFTLCLKSCQKKRQTISCSSSLIISRPVCIF